jgi:hypothetical protein
MTEQQQHGSLLVVQPTPVPTFSREKFALHPVARTIFLELAPDLVKLIEKEFAKYFKVGKDKQSYIKSSELCEVLRYISQNKDDTVDCSEWVITVDMTNPAELFGQLARLDDIELVMVTDMLARMNNNYVQFITRSPIAVIMPPAKSKLNTDDDDDDEECTEKKTT